VVVVGEDVPRQQLRQVAVEQLDDGINWHISTISQCEPDFVRFQKQLLVLVQLVSPVEYQDVMHQTSGYCKLWQSLMVIAVKSTKQVGG